MGNQLTVSTVMDVGTSMRELPDHELDVVLHSTRFMKVGQRGGGLVERERLR